MNDAPPLPSESSRTDAEATHPWITVRIRGDRAPQEEDKERMRDAAYDAVQAFLDAFTHSLPNDLGAFIDVQTGEVPLQ